MGIKEVIKQGKFKSNLHQAVINIIYTYNYIHERNLHVLKPYDINVQHYNILRILRGKYPGPATPSQIKEVMLDKRGDLTRLVDKLVKMGLVTREICEDNRRMMHIRISDQGLKILSEIDPEIDAFYETQQALTEEEAGILSDLLDKFRG